MFFLYSVTKFRHKWDIFSKDNEVIFSLSKFLLRRIQSDLHILAHFYNLRLSIQLCNMHKYTIHESINTFDLMQDFLCAKFIRELKASLNIFIIHCIDISSVFAKWNGVNKTSKHVWLDSQRSLVFFELYKSNFPSTYFLFVL